jgi:elongation factor P--(R)-beta-lysine ligase
VSPARTATLETLRLRAEMLARVRAFFAARGVLEVETPLLSPAAASDPALESIAAHVGSLGAIRYLHTSPELAMKRLLASGAGDIYQICAVFRDGEIGRWHQPEFTMLEWYRLGFDDDRLMDEVEALGVDVPPGLDDDALLDLAFAVGVAPALPREAWTFVHEFPASQAALARIKPSHPAVAARFELFASGLELANGFAELTDAREQRRRFEADREVRRTRGLPLNPIDEDFLAALEQGLPECAGVALGFDRLVAVAAGLPSLAEAVAFAHVSP